MFRYWHIQIVRLSLITLSLVVPAVQNSRYLSHSLQQDRKGPCTFFTDVAYTSFASSPVNCSESLAACCLYACMFYSFRSNMKLII